MRQIVLDTETTGLSTHDGNRIIEIGCVEIIDRRYTGEVLHLYINPERDSEEEALAVHGLTSDFLANKPKFAQVADQFLAFVDDAELLIHNAPFDIGFIDHELALLGGDYGKILDRCRVLDTLVLARQLFPGQRASLDALCKRFGVDNSNRELHGALLDARLLAEVYLAMTGGQVGLSLEGDSGSNQGPVVEEIRRLPAARPRLRVIQAAAEELALHQEALAAHAKKAENGVLWGQ